LAAGVVDDLEPRRCQRRLELQADLIGHRTHDPAPIVSAHLPRSEAGTQATRPRLPRMLAAAERRGRALSQSVVTGVRLRGITAASILVRAMTRSASQQEWVPDALRARIRGCDRPGCAGEGVHRAPRSRDRLNEYFWFCLDHVREYNASWNYYEGMSEEEVEASVRSDTTWQRPTWPLGGRFSESRRTGPLGGGYRYWRANIRDDFGFFGDGGEAHPGGKDGPRREAQNEETEALAVMELEAPLTLAELKARYKSLVKQHHPDANGGDKAAEERLKVINRAYSTLKKLLAA
jgi:hypothetical protein